MQRVSISYTDHKQSAPLVASLFPGLKPADLPDGEGWAVEQVNISTHNDTHLDAPYHFASTMDGGKRAPQHSSAQFGHRRIWLRRNLGEDRLMLVFRQFAR